MNLSPHFTLEEMTRSNKARDLGIDNTPPPFVVDALRRLCVHVLEPLREACGKPLVVKSGYRSPKLNDVTPGASSTSQHCKGEAVDLECEVPGFEMSNLDLGALIERLAAECVIDFDQLIYEHVKARDPRAGWVHVSYRDPSAARNRRMVLSINK